MLPPRQLLVLNRLGGSARTIRRELRGLAKAGVDAEKALSSLEVFLGDLDSLAGVTPSTPKPTTPSPATSTKVSKPPIDEKPAPKPTCSDATTPPPEPPLTARSLETILQTALRPVYARLDILEASRAAAAALPPTSPSSPPQAADDHNEAANASFAEVVAHPVPSPAWPRPAPTPARTAPIAAEPKFPSSHLFHLYAQADLTVPKTRQALGVPPMVPVRQTRSGDVLIHLPNATAASCLRLAALEAGFSPATPLALFAVVVHGLPMTEDRLVEAIEGRVAEVGVVRSVRRLPSRREGAECGSAIVVLWNNEVVSHLLSDEGRLWIDPVTCVRCERARGKKEMTHEGEAGKPAERTAGGARAAPGGSKGMQKGAAGAQEQKKRERREEKKEKDEPARANLAKSGGGSLATSPSLDGNGCNVPITTITTSSTPTNPFEPILPPKLSDFSIERSGNDDFGTVLEENGVPAGATGQQVSPPPVVYAAPLLRAPAKSNGVESRVSKESSTSAESTSAPFSPSLRAPSNELHRTYATPSKDASAPSAAGATFTGNSDLGTVLEAEKTPAGAMHQQVSHLPVEYAAPALHAPAKSYGVETRVSEESSTSAESE